MICALENMGNTCYMNSILQLLIHCNDFIHFIISSNYNNPNIESFKNFIHKYQQSKKLAPIDIKIILHNNNIFNSYHQCDAHEFMISFIDIIDKELKKINKEINIYELFFNFKYNTIIKNLKQEETKIILFEELFLTLPFSESLEKSIEIFESHEIIDSWESELYKNYTKAEKNIKISSLPQYFFILINRYDMMGNKIDKKMNIPMKLQNHILRGGVIHYGINQFGHYTSIIHKDDKFYNCDDDIITEINENNFLNLASIAYILLYIKN
jgi:ubiquitin C-terminal hydrolase